MQIFIKKYFLSLIFSPTPPLASARPHATQKRRRETAARVPAQARGTNPCRQRRTPIRCMDQKSFFLTFLYALSWEIIGWGVNDNDWKK